MVHTSAGEEEEEGGGGRILLPPCSHWLTGDVQREDLVSIFGFLDG